MTRIAFIGAGSLVFARRLIADILSFPELSDTTFALMDIDAKRLDYLIQEVSRLKEPYWLLAAGQRTKQTECLASCPTYLTDNASIHGRIRLCSWVC